MKSEYSWRSDLDYSLHPELYEIGRGQQGVLVCQPYKSRLLPLWRFRTPEAAEASAAALWKEFLRYLEIRDFVGADLSKKFLHMGYTRSRRYANHSNGRKYAADGSVLPLALDRENCEKALSAQIFRKVWEAARSHPDYLELRRNFQRASAKTKMANNITNNIRVVGNAGEGEPITYKEA